ISPFSREIIIRGAADENKYGYVMTSIVGKDQGPTSDGASSQARKPMRQKTDSDFDVAKYYNLYALHVVTHAAFSSLMRVILV
ncbi:hypothetical protein BDM02DRAFT_3123556, partial [Thelephora ganbajun]